MKNFILVLFTIVLLSSCSDHKDGHEDHDHESHEGHDHSSHDEHDHSNCDHGSSIELSTQAQKNMKIELLKLKKSNFSKYHSIPAEIRHRPESVQYVFAPYSGRLKSISLETGEHLEGGRLVLEIVRSAIKRPSIEILEDILSPASEEYHNTVLELRSTIKSLEVVDVELNRLNSFQNKSDGVSVIPQKDLIDLKYEKSKLIQQLENQRKKLKFHGLSDLEVKQIEKEDVVKRPQDFWLNILKQNNIWNKASEKLYQSLPIEKRNDHWVIATIGVLNIENLINDKLIQLLKEGENGNYFLEIAKFLQDGRSIEDIKSLIELAVFNSVIKIKLPNSSLGWEISKIHVKEGQFISEGDKLLTIEDHSNAYLYAQAKGSEIKLLKDALKGEYKLSATPLINGGGIELSDLEIIKFLELNNSISAIIGVKNKVFKTTSFGAKRFKSWELQSGLKYKLNIPVEVYEDVYVVPSEAVVENGADMLVFVKNGSEFQQKNVVVLSKDSDFAVLHKSSDLWPNNEIVTKGAYDIQLVMIAGSPQAVDPHAGHNH